MNLEIIFATIFFFLPAYLANAVPPLLNRFKIGECLAVPIDCNKTIKGKEILGSHKTWRGAIGTIVIGILLIVLFFELNRNFHLYEVINFNYLDWNPFIFGFIFSLGIVFGDLFFAFVKRRLFLKPGAPFIPFDQTNYVFGIFLFLQSFINLDLSIWFVIFIQTFIIHVLFNRIGYLLGLHNAKW
ncbi:MAG: CDP-archaeol synthase [Candidatus Pacebacteria bacterium]|nr:CDP-archaeol synthase [Candidatus Paceibacterota bacterium]